MFSFNRKEQIALLLLCAALLVGGIVHVVERYTEEDLPDFDVQKAAVAVPQAPAGAAETPAPADSVSAPLDLNRASAAELTRLPGIGPKTAALIVQHREQHGRFRTPEDLVAVRGIGPKTLARLRPLITVQNP